MLSHQSGVVEARNFNKPVRRQHQSPGLPRVIALAAELGRREARAAAGSLPAVAAHLDAIGRRTATR